MSKNNLHFWLEAEVPTAGQAPQSDPYAPQQGGNFSQQQPSTPPQDGSDPSAQMQPQPEDDVTKDPKAIETPKSKEQDFEQWRHEFMEFAEKCDNTEMMNSINTVRDLPGLEAPQRKFVEDNFQIFAFRRDSNILKA